MVDPVIVKEWIAKAEEDYRFAEVNLREERDFFPQICFHFQQAAEKFLKAFIKTARKPQPFKAGDEWQPGAKRRQKCLCLNWKPRALARGSSLSPMIWSSGRPTTSAGFSVSALETTRRLNAFGPTANFLTDFM
jgi:hypothetical protein